MSAFIWEFHVHDFVFDNLLIAHLSIVGATCLPSLSSLQSLMSFFRIKVRFQGLVFLINDFWLWFVSPPEVDVCFQNLCHVDSPILSNGYPLIWRSRKAQFKLVRLKCYSPNVLISLFKQLLNQVGCVTKSNYERVRCVVSQA